MLNQEQINHKWSEIKNGMRMLWGNLTDEELERSEKDLTAVSEIVQLRTGETKSAIKEKMERLMSSFENKTDSSTIKDQSSFKRRPEDLPDTQNNNIKDLIYSADDVTGTDHRVKSYQSERADFDSDRNARH